MGDLESLFDGFQKLEDKSEGIDAVYAMWQRQPLQLWIGVVFLKGDHKDRPYNMGQLFPKN